MKKLMNMPAAKIWLAIAIAIIYLLPLVITEGIAAAYIKFDGVDGECKDQAHNNWINVDSVQLGAGRAISGAGTTRSAGPAIFKDISVTKWIDKSSPILMQGVCQGRVYPKVEIDVVAAAGDPSSSNTNYTTYVLENVMVSSFSTHGSATGDPVPSEQLSLNFTKIEIEHTSQNSSGVVEFSTNITCVVEDR